MEEILEMIRTADATQVDFILEAAMKRKRELYPAWQIIYYAKKRGEKDDFEWLRAMISKME